MATITKAKLSGQGNKVLLLPRLALRVMHPAATRWPLLVTTTRLGMGVNPDRRQ